MRRIWLVIDQAVWPCSRRAVSDTAAARAVVRKMSYGGRLALNFLVQVTARWMGVDRDLKSLPAKVYTAYGG